MRRSFFFGKIVGERYTVGLEFGGKLSGEFEQIPDGVLLLEGDAIQFVDRFFQVGDLDVDIDDVFFGHVRISRTRSGGWPRAALPQ